MSMGGALRDDATGRENVYLDGELAERRDSDSAAIVNDVAEFTELGAFFDRPVRTYSSGMRARLAFGVSLAIDFECYLVDEITAVGDSRFQKRSKAAFKEKLKRANIIMVSHSNSTLRDYCEVGAVLHEGRLTLYDDLKEAISQHEANQNS
jgi:capsular polysaccharide transport system ATP-binding protein